MSSAINHRRRSHRSETAHRQAMLAMPQYISPYASRLGFFPTIHRQKTVPKT